MRLAPPVFATHRPGPWLVPDPNIAASILALCQRGKRSMVRLPIATAALRSAAVQPAYRRFTPPHRAKLTREQHLMPREAVTFARPLRHHVTKPRLWPVYFIGCRDCSNVRGLQPNGENQRPIEHRGAANGSRFLRNRPPLPCAKVGLWPILPASNWASLARRNRRSVVADVSVKWADQAACRQVGGFQRVLPGRGCRMTLYRSCYPGWSGKPDLPGTLRAANIVSRVDRRPGAARFFAALPTVKGTRKCCQTPLNAGSDGG